LSLSGRAFLWWHRRSFQTDFWRALTGVLEVHDPRDTRKSRPAEEPAAVRPTGFTRSLSGLLDRLKEAGARFGGFSLARSEITSENRVRAVLAAETERVELDIGPRRPGAPSYIEAGPYLLTYPMDCPLTTDAQRAAAAEFAAALEKLADS
jgi:hypothetical protein